MEIVLSKATKQNICRSYAEELVKILHARKIRCGINLDATVWVKRKPSGGLQIATYKLGDVPVEVAVSMIQQWAMGALTPQHLTRIITQACWLTQVVPVDSAPSKAPGAFLLDKEMQFREELERKGVDLNKEKAEIEKGLAPGEKFGEWKFSD